MARTRIGRLAGRLVEFLQGLATGAGLAALRFPLACCLLVVIAVLSNLAVGDVYLLTERDTVWLLAALYAATAASVAATVAVESLGLAVPAQLAVSAVAAALIGVPVWFGPALDVFPTTLVLAATFAVPLAPTVGGANSSQFWTFAFWTVIGVALAFLSVVIFVSGLSAILEMVRFLFEVGISLHTYGHLVVTALTFVGPLFALGRIPRAFDDVMPFSSDDRLIAGVRILVDWVAVPLALLTAAVLHAYVAKIVLTGQVPTNQIGWIASFYAVFILALRVAVGPFAEGGAVSTRMFARFFAPLLTVPLALLAYAIWLRIEREGVTLERYYVVVGAAAGLLVVATQAIPRWRGDLRIVAAVPTVLLALSSFGPWGVADVVGRSQADLVLAEVASKSSPVGADDAAELRSRIRALDDVAQLDRIGPLLERSGQQNLDEVLAAAPGRAADTAIGALGLGLPTALAAPSRSFNATEDSVVEIGEFDRVTNSRPIRQTEGDGEAGGNESIELRLSGNVLVMRVGAVVDRFELSAMMSGLPGAVFTSDPDDLPPPLVTLTSHEGRTIRLWIEQLVTASDATVESGRAGEAALEEMVSSVFYRQVEW